NNGKAIDFRNVILIMTTNAGAADLARAAYGFTRSKREGDDEEAINKMFTPEFRNRLDATIAFSNLPPPVIAKVVEKFIFELEAQLADRNVSIELSDKANAWLAERGYDEMFGARPLGRVIQEHIKTPLAEEVLFGKLKKGGVVKVGVTKGGKELSFEFVEESPVKPKPPAEALRKRAARSGKKPAAKKKPPKGGGKKGGDGSSSGGGSGGGGSLVPRVPLLVE
ncbi:MAG TPA: AAA family ATPase, partial [Hyphomicrobiales bacterium]|nr:AAA family ATPase [Hyphomicrobiales bacterium]